MTTSSQTKTGASALAIPAFRALWLNNVSFFVVSNAQRFALGWLVLDGLGGGESEQGLVVFALGLPSIFLVLQAGAWADRHDRRLLLLGSQLAATAIMVVAAVLIGLDLMTMGLAMAVAVAAGSASTIGQPVRSSLVPILVDRPRLFNAIAVTALAMTSSMILGPVLVERVGSVFGFDGAFWFMALVLGLGTVALRKLHVPDIEDHQPPELNAEQPGSDAALLPDRSAGSASSGRLDSDNRADRPGIWAGTLEAAGHVLADKSLSRLFLLLTVAGLTVNPAVMVSLQAFVKTELGRDAGDAAPLLALMGVGIAISSVVVMKRGDMPNKGSKFQVAMMTGSFCTFWMGRTTSYEQLLPLVFVMGLAGGFYINMNQGLIQANTPQAIMGRVMGLFTLIQAGFTPIGALILGLLASQFGVGNVISGAAALGFVVALTVYVTGSELRRLA